MATETVRFRITGIRPLLMHNGRLANPMDEVTKELKRVTSKRKKTDEDLIDIKNIELKGGLYVKDGKVVVTEDMILGAVVEGARKRKNGKAAQAGVFCAHETFPLEYKGPKDLAKLAEDPSFCEYRAVGVNGSRVMRARPKFNQWSVTVELLVDNETIDVDAVREALEAAGKVVGLGDFRPRYGRFEVKQVA